MSVHSPENLYENEPPPSDADLRAVQKTLWEVDPDEVDAELPAPVVPPAAAAEAAATTSGDELLLKTYLRLRPLTPREVDLQKNENAFLTVESKTDVLTHPPKNSVAFKNGGRGGDSACQYSFSQIFAPETTQHDLFVDTTVPLVQDVLLGGSALLFTYGVTNAGKTYTVQGTQEHPGLLPRTLDVIFNSIGDTQHANDDAQLRPAYFADVIETSPAECAGQDLLKETVLEDYVRATAADAMAVTDGEEGKDNECDDDASAAAEPELNVEAEKRRFYESHMHRVRDERLLETDPNCTYAVFVSYAEVYNEQVYDLLVTMTGKRREAARLGEKNGEVYIRGVRHFRVFDTADALQLVSIGRRNRKVAATKSNHQSSRSHSLFTIKLIRQDVEMPEHTAISQFTIVDLAGSERYKKTDAAGMRIKEAGTINTSLMTLGKCLESMRSKQAGKSNSKIIPYRDSKLTRLFKHYLQGKGSISMVVNVANLNETFDETAHVLKFSALARKVTAGAVVSKIDTGISRLEREIQAREVEAGLLADITDLDAYVSTLMQTLHEVKQQLFEAQREAANTEERVRAEVADEMAQQMAELEERYENAMALQTEATEAKYAKKWGVYTRSVARMPAVSRTQAGVADSDVDSHVVALECDLQAQRAVTAALQAEMDSVHIETAEREAKLSHEIERLWTMLDAREKELEKATKNQDEYLVMRDTAEKLKKEVGEVVAHRDELAKENTRLSEAARTVSFSQTDFQKLREDHEDLKKGSTSDLQKSKLVIASLRRKVEEQKDEIETLRREIGSEESKNDRLRGQLISALDDRIELGIKEVSDSQIIPPDVDEPTIQQPSQSKKIEAEAAASAAPADKGERQARRISQPAVTTPAVPPTTTQPAQLAGPPSAAKTPIRVTRSRRQAKKRKGTPAPDKENTSSVASTGRYPKKTRTSGAPSASLLDNAKAGSRSKLSAVMMSPLRRLRPRRKKGGQAGQADLA